MKATYKGLVIGMLLAIGISVIAFSEPPLAPPGGNVPAPINVSGTEQAKAGRLRIGGGLNYWINKLGDSFTLQNNAGVNQFIVGQDGNVGIGRTDPSKRLDIKQASDSQGTGAGIRVTNTAGTGYTQLFTGGDNVSYLFNGIGGYMTLTNAGNVGIGMTGPSQKLDVAGQIHASGDICMDAGGGRCLSTSGGDPIVLYNACSNISAGFDVRCATSVTCPAGKRITWAFGMFGHNTRNLTNISPENAAYFRKCSRILKDQGGFAQVYYQVIWPECIGQTGCTVDNSVDNNNSAWGDAACVRVVCQ